MGWGGVGCGGRVGVVYGVGVGVEVGGGGRGVYGVHGVVYC